MKLLAAFASKGGSPGTSSWPKDWRTLLADSRLRDLMLVLFRRGQQIYWTEPMHSDWFIEPLAAIGDAEVEESFARAFVEPSHLRRKAKLAEVLVSSDHPVVVERFASRGDWLLSADAVEVGRHDKRSLTRLARAYVGWLDRRQQRTDLERFIAGVIEGPFSSELTYELLDRAATEGMTGVRPAIDAVLDRLLGGDNVPHSSSHTGFAHYGGALATFDPAEALERFAPLWDRCGSLSSSRASSAFALRAGILVPLLGSTGRDSYLAAAAEIETAVGKRLKKSDNGWLWTARHLLHGYRLSGAERGVALAERYADFENRGESKISEQIRREAQRILRTGG